MNWLDIIFIGIIVISIIVSLFRGLFKEVFSLLIWIVAFWVAYQFADEGADAISGFIDLPSARHLIAFVGLFIATLIVGGLINFLISKLVSKTGLSATDRFLGMFFGAIRGLVVIVVCTFFIKATPLSEDMWWQESKLAPHFGRLSEWVRVQMPEEFSQYFTFLKPNEEKPLQQLLDKFSRQQADKLSTHEKIPSDTSVPDSNTQQEKQ